MYYTAYELYVPDDTENVEAITKEIEALKLPDYGTWKGGWAAWGSWYDHEEDMKELSKKFPDVVFDLFGDGEESEDRWHKYFKNGRMQYCPCRFEFDPYDESKLV